MEICLFYSIFVIILFKELTFSYLEIACASFMMFYRQMLAVVCICVYFLGTLLHVCLNLKEEREKSFYLFGTINFL